MPGGRARLVMVVAALAMGTSAAACAKARPPAVQAIPAAASRTVQEGTSRISVVTGAGDESTITAAGVVDHRARRGQLELEDISPLGLPGSGGRGTVILDGDIRFVRLPEAPAGAPGRPWVLVNLEGGRTDLDTGVHAGGVRSLHRLDPLLAVTLLQAAGGDARKVANERVTGTETTHYATTVQVTEATNELPPALRGYFDRSMSPFGGRVAVDVWVDGAGRVRRVRYSGAAPASEAGAAAGTATTTLELSDFGVPVAVRNPPAEETVDVLELLERVPGS